MAYSVHSAECNCCHNFKIDIVIKVQSLVRGYNTRKFIKNSFAEFYNLCQDIEKLIQKEEPFYQSNLVNEGKVRCRIR